MTTTDTKPTAHIQDDVRKDLEKTPGATAGAVAGHASNYSSDAASSRSSAEPAYRWVDPDNSDPKAHTRDK